MIKDYISSNPSMDDGSVIVVSEEPSTPYSDQKKKENNNVFPRLHTYGCNEKCISFIKIRTFENFPK